jgi:RNA polymerase sigma factor (sigma-70 family)
MKNKLSEYKNVEALAMTMTRNLCFDRIKSKRWSNVSMDESYHNSIAGHDPYKKAEFSDSMEHIKNIINQLPEKQSTIIQLRDIEAYEFKEISEITGMALDTVRVNLSRARKKIKSELDKIHNYGVKRA